MDPAPSATTSPALADAAIAEASVPVPVPDTDTRMLNLVPLTVKELDELEKRFTYHKPQNEETVAAHDRVRADCGGLADFLTRLLPPSRERSQAITAIDDAMKHANACIARNGLRDGVSFS